MQINWEKKGLIFKCENRSFFKSHTTRPIPILLGDTIRLFLSSRDKDDMPYPTFIDVSADNPSEVLYIHEKPLFELGRTGTFDDSGITPVSILVEESRRLMYYVGWKRRRYGVTIEPSIGVATINESFSEAERLFEGPILGQNPDHPLFTAAPFVVRWNHSYFMWYCSGTDWINTEHGPEMVYTIFQAVSDDGLNWKQLSGDPAIPYKFDGEVVSAPWVVKLDGKFLMWYSTRGSATKKDKNFDIGLAESFDGISWLRKDQHAGITRSNDGWDSQMICYPAVINFLDKTYMFYSGNGSGRGGIGYAVANQQIEIKNW